MEVRMDERFQEIRKVMTPNQAQIEACRCLVCENPPCNEGCPAEVDVKRFIRALRFENPRRAIQVIRESNCLAGVCGTVCPTENLCEKACSSTELTTPIRIGELQRYAAEQGYSLKLRNETGDATGDSRVAVIGSGPAGLAAALELRRLGLGVTVFEKLSRPGGVLSWGIAPYRLPMHVIEREIGYIEEAGAEFRLSSPVTDLDALFEEGYSAVFIGTGTGASLRVGIPGEDLEGVYWAIPFLKEVSKVRWGDAPSVEIGPRLVVIGGGSVAMDAACSARRLGAESIEIVCLESPVEMPAYRVEVEQAWDEGLQFHTRSKPLEILGKNGKVVGLRGIRIEWREPEKYVPSNAVEIPGTEFTLAADTIIESIGQKPSEEALKLTEGLRSNGRGLLMVDPETYMTSRPGVFAGGDVVSGGGTTVVKSVFEGKSAARAMAKYLESKED
jgi:glutamate synthase (NADPH/NADH) small chain